MSDMEGPPLDEVTRALLKRAARGGSKAPTEARARVLARVDAVLGPDGPGGPSGGTQGGSSPASPSPSSWALRALPYVATFVLGGGAGVLATRMLSTPPAAPPPQIVYIERPAPPAASSSAAGEEATAVPATSAIVAKPPSRPPPSADTQPDIGAERKLLDVARHALDGEDGAAALAAVSEHERRFPGGVLVQEREAMGVRALLLLGRTGEARARAARFRSRFPSSVLLPAIESAVGAPSAP
jgi:hypothetical protein